MHHRLGFQFFHLCLFIYFSFIPTINQVSAKYNVALYQSNPIKRFAGSGKIWFVHDTATGANNGTSWVDAFPSLQSALDAAALGDEIWVAHGTYWPTTLKDPMDPLSATFQLKNGISIYGGFGGTETSLESRDWKTNISILSGDIDHNDLANPASDISQIVGNNAYHVVTGSGTDTTAVLDGFVMTAGKTKDEVSYVCAPSCGGGMIVIAGSPTLRNSTFIGNQARLGGGLGTFQSNLIISYSTFDANLAGPGGGMYVLNGNPSVDHVLFSNNSGGAGGGLYTDHSSPSVTNVIFYGNSAWNGAGFSNANYSNPEFTNVLFNSNIASNIGGAIENDYHANLTLTNVTLVNNTAVNSGGGVWNADNSNITLINVTITSNSGAYGGGIYNNMSGNITLRNSILWGNIPDQILDGYGSSHTATYSDIQGVTVNPGAGNINLDPQLGLLGNYGGSIQVVPLQPNSPAINKVPTSQCLDKYGGLLTYDQRGVTRPQGCACDMGAFEIIMLSTFLPIINR